MTIQKLKIAALIAFNFVLCLTTYPVSAQVLPFFPTATPAQTSPTQAAGGRLVLPTNTPLPSHSPVPTSSLMHISLQPSGPVNKIPVQGQTGIYVDNATDTAVARDGGQMYIGGIFTQVNLGSAEAVPRMRLALLNLTTQQVDPWNPSPNNKVETLALDSAQLYVGGRFTEIAGQPRAFFASFDRATGELTSFQPNPNDEVYAIHTDASKTWVGGRFNAIAGENRLRLVAFVKPNNPLDTVNLDANSHVYTMAGSDTTLYVGGAFTEIGGVPRRYIAAIDKATGRVTDWAPQLNDEVRNVTIVDNRIVVSGPFTTLNDTETANYRAIIDPVNGSVSTLETINTQGTPVAGNPTTLTLTIKINQQDLGFAIPNLSEILTFIIRLFLVIVGLIALFYLLIGALEWITSGGEEEKIESSRKKIVAAIVGVILVIVVLAVIVTLEQVIFRGKICVGISCGASIPSLIEPLEETQ